MPTFENNVPPAAKPSDKSDPGLASEFRPRRREQWANAEGDQTYDPVPIPPDVKKSIDQRVNEIMRQSRGPDETFFALHEWLSTAKKVIFSIPTLIRDIIRRPKEEDEDESENDESESGERGKPGTDKPQQRKNDAQKSGQQQQHRGRRGGRRHNRRGGGGRGHQNPGRNDSSE